MTVADFRQRYEQHVAGVAAGDMKSVLADMVQENLPAVFDGVQVPKGAIDSYTVVDVRAEGELMVGETVYRCADGGVIGLRSIWESRDGVWLAAELANFEVA